MGQPRVSIVLPVRDGAGTLGRALESCLAQTFGDFELIVVDDGSVDASGEIAREYAKRDPRVRLIVMEKPGGIVSALRAGTEAARAGLIARMDADDVAHPDRIGEQVRFLDEHPEIAACGCGVRIVRRDGAGQALDPEPGFARYEAWINGLTEPEAIAHERFVESPLVHPSVVMRRAALEAAGGWRDPGWAEDYDLWLRMLGAGMRLAKIPRVLLEWSDGPERLTRTDPRYAPAAFLRAKAHYLVRVDGVTARGVMISGAGPTGKRLAALLQREGVCVHAFFDPHPRRVGKRIGGVIVMAEDAIPPAAPEAPVQLGAVGQPGARERIGRLVSARGYREGIDFFNI